MTSSAASKMVSNELAEGLEPIKRLYWMILWAAVTVPLLLYFVVLLIVMGNEPDPMNAMGQRYGRHLF
jgi:hypothetical protein